MKSLYPHLLQGAHRQCSALATFVDEQLADVRRTYDPKVARLVERRKVMVMKGAFDKL